MVLSNRQKSELDKSIIAYLESSGHAQIAKALLAELQASTPGFTPPDASHQQLLEKKWASIIRMNKKIMELEATAAQLRTDLESAQRSGVGGMARKAELTFALPRAPERHTLKGHRDAVRCVAFHPVYSVLASASEDATIKVWDMESGRLERTLQGHQDAVTCIEFSPDEGKMIASCSTDMSVKIWSFDEAMDYACLKTLQGHDHSVSCVRWIPIGVAAAPNTPSASSSAAVTSSSEYVLSASRDRSIKQWDIRTGYCIRTFTGHEGWVRTMSIHPSGQRFISSGQDSNLFVWNVSSGALEKQINVEHSHVVECVLYSNGRVDSFIDQWRKEQNSLNGTTTNDANAAAASTSIAAASSTAASPASSSSSSSNSATGIGGNYLASCSRDRSIRIVDVISGNVLAVLIGHDNWITSLVWHTSGRFLLSSSDDKSVRVWDIQKGFKQVRVMEQAHEQFVSTLAMSPIQPLMATAGVDTNVKIWECR